MVSVIMNGRKGEGNERVMALLGWEKGVRETVIVVVVMEEGTGRWYGNGSRRRMEREMM